MKLAEIEWCEIEEEPQAHSAENLVKFPPLKEGIHTS